jgi:hypothetical protein
MNLILSNLAFYYLHIFRRKESSSVQKKKEKNSWDINAYPYIFQ